jgi:hypothetical protein
MKTTAVFLALLALLSSTALAQVPRTINYQGRIMDGTAPLTGEHTMDLRIYTSPAGGTPLHDETQTVTFNNGIFTVAIGGSEPLDPAIFSGQVWLGVTISGVNGGQELTPRFILRSSPYSFHAAIADSATDAALADSSIAAARAATALRADSARGLLLPATMARDAKEPALTVTNNGGPGLIVTGKPNAITATGSVGTTDHFVAGGSAGASAAPVSGGIYRDNVPIAWGTIDANGTIISDFGIASVAQQADQSYVITLDNAVQASTQGNPSYPELSASITLASLPGVDLENIPSYAIWAPRRISGAYDLKSLSVKIYAITGQGQGTATTHSFSIVIYGRP